MVKNLDICELFTKVIKWVLLNVQSQNEFNCQCLNRDVWSDDTVKEIVKENFVFIWKRVNMKWLQLKIDTNKSLNKNASYKSNNHVLTSTSLLLSLSLLTSFSNQLVRHSPS